MRNLQSTAKKRTIVFVAIVVHFQLVSSNELLGQPQTPYRPAVGKPHFDFLLPSIEDGKEVRLSDYRGKKILLFHFASW